METIDLQEAYTDITSIYDTAKEGESIILYYFKKYPFEELPGDNPNKLISNKFIISNDENNLIEINYDCRDGNRTFETKPDSNIASISLVIDGKPVASKSYRWHD